MSPERRFLPITPDSMHAISYALQKAKTADRFTHQIAIRYPVEPSLAISIANNRLRAKRQTPYEFGTILGIYITHQLEEATGITLSQVKANTYPDPADVSIEGLLGNFSRFNNDQQRPFYNFIVNTSGQFNDLAKRQSYLLGLVAVIPPAIASLEAQISVKNNP